MGDLLLVILIGCAILIVILLIMSVITLRDIEDDVDDLLWRAKNEKNNN